jgi:leader peptidase (prepilin peptidase) / N-methyltransferase
MDALLFELQLTPWLLPSLVAVVGAILGSFINVVGYRYPAMLDALAREEAMELLELVPSPHAEQATLFSPASHCPHCGSAVRWRHNIPILGWLVLRGRCADCRAPISPWYPIVELIGAIAAALVMWRFGPTWTAAVMLAASMLMLCAAVVDARSMWLPDALTLTVLWLGLIAAALGVGSIAVSTAVLTAAAAYGTCWLLGATFALITDRDGLGGGDGKLLAAIGAIGGPASVLFALLLGSVLSVVAAVAISRVRQASIAGTRWPFGPWLAIGGFVGWLFGDRLVQLYWSAATG